MNPDYNKIKAIPIIWTSCILSEINTPDYKNVVERRTIPVRGAKALLLEM
jgi:hypothetical protein